MCRVVSQLHLLVLKEFALLFGCVSGCLSIAPVGIESVFPRVRAVQNRGLSIAPVGIESQSSISQLCQELRLSIAPVGIERVNSFPYSPLLNGSQLHLLVLKVARPHWLLSGDCQLSIAPVGIESCPNRSPDYQQLPSQLHLLVLKVLNIGEVRIVILPLNCTCWY